MSHPQHPGPTRPPRTILDRLDREWTRLTVTSSELARVRRWQLPGGDVSSLDDVLARCGYRFHPAAMGSSALDARQRQLTDDTADSDAFLVRVLTLARTEPLAARIVLQRILPALARLARRHAAGPHQQQGLLDDLVANAWSVIRAYPVERRPRRVVSNLVRDIGFQTMIRPIRRRQAGEIPTSTDRLDRTAEPTMEPLAELVEVLTSARDCGAVDARDLALLGALMRRGRADLVADELGVTPRTVRNHRDAAVHRLRAFVATAA